MTTILIAVAAISMTTYLLARVKRLEEVVEAQQNSLLEVDMYAQQVEENTMDILTTLEHFEDVLEEDYPDIVEEPEPSPTYPPAYDEWGEFDA